MIKSDAQRLTNSSKAKCGDFILNDIIGERGVCNGDTLQVQINDSGVLIYEVGDIRDI